VNKIEVIKQYMVCVIHFKSGEFIVWLKLKDIKGTCLSHML